MNWTFDAENNDGRCAFCNQKETLDHVLTVQAPDGTTEFAVCEDCAASRIAGKLSKRINETFYDVHVENNPGLKALVTDDTDA